MPATSAEHRAQLAEFLKSRRARVSPIDAGLAPTGRRRTPGLRREDVAALAGLSATWYTWLEQGRDVRPSDRVLENLSRTLRLSAEERDYLFALAQSRPAPLASQISEAVSPAVQRMLDALNVPAMVMTIRWDVVAWNRLVTHHFRDYAAMPSSERNLFKILMTGPDYIQYPDEYLVMARRIVSKLHVDYSQAGGDPAFDRLIEELSGLSALFRDLWRSPEIMGRSEGVHLMRHPSLGGITLEHTSYVVEGQPSLRVVIFAPYDADSAAKMDRLARGDDLTAQAR